VARDTAGEFLSAGGALDISRWYLEPPHSKGFADTKIFHRP
jgi:hypothetical protein